MVASRPMAHIHTLPLILCEAYGRSYGLDLSNINVIIPCRKFLFGRFSLSIEKQKIHALLP